MWTCSNCGREVADAARFCVGCGRAAPPPAAPAVCPNCGVILLPAAKFCGSCGVGAMAAARQAASPGSRNIGRLVAGAAIFVVAAASVVVALAYWGGGDKESGLTFAKVAPVDKDVVAMIDRTFADLPEPAGANDRDQVRSIMGTPDAFLISFERAGKDGDGAAVRYETWYYYELLSAFEFADGKLISNMPIDEVLGPTLLPRGYDPATFKRSMRWEDARALVADPAKFEARTLPAEFDVPIVFYAGEQLLLGFDDEGLVYAETIPLGLVAAP